MNNNFNGLKASGRVLLWLFLLEEYGVTFEYLPGKIFVVADALSSLDIDDLHFLHGYSGELTSVLSIVFTLLSSVSTTTTFDFS